MSQKGKSQALFVVRRSVQVWAAALLFLCLGSVRMSWADPAVADHVKGLVERKEPGATDWHHVQPGDRLPEGAEVRTGDKSRVELTTPQGHRLRLAPGTLVQLSSLQDGKTKTYLARGKVLSQVKPLKPLEQFAIQTPTAVCAVRGTEFVTGTDEKGTSVDVYKGIVGFLAKGSGNEVAVHAGESASVLRDGSIVPPHRRGAINRGAESPLAGVARHEVALDMTRNQVMAAAAAEERLADYREGKSLIDVNGNRVRLEEYIMRPQPNQFKFVVLDQRERQQLDYFFYLGTFNQNLPADLSVPLKQLSGAYGPAAPAYYLTSYEMGQSNTQDTVHDTATGGHLVDITVNSSGDYVLTDPTNPANTRTIVAEQLQADGTYKIYNPLSDNFSTVTAAQLSASTKFGVYLPENDTFKDSAPGDTFWKTRFNSYTHALDNVTKITYNASGSNNILASNLDANWTYAGGFVLPVVTVDPNNIDATITNYYGDGTFESYRTVLIDDNGHVAPQSAFSGVSTGSQYRNELLRWNYEQQVSASEFQGRKIDLVVEPKIFIESGLIQ